MSRKEQGFTIVELMIATAVFSVVLLLCSFAIIHVGRMYYKGVITNRTQDTSRKIIDDISRAIQFGSSSDNFRREGSGSFPNSGAVQALCLGGVRYTFSKERHLGGSQPALRHVLWKDRISQGGSCQPLNLSLENPATTPGVEQPGEDGVELLGENMRVPLLSVTEINGVWDVKVRIVHGDSVDLFADGNNYGICKGVNAAGQYCAVSELNTTVIKRL